MPRRTSNSAAGLRALLIAERERSLRRWAIPGKPDQFLEDLRAGAEVRVSSAQLLCAVMHAGLSYRQFAFGGADWGRSFTLDEHDQLREWNG